MGPEDGAALDPLGWGDGVRLVGGSAKLPGPVGPPAVVVLGTPGEDAPQVPGEGCEHGAVRPGNARPDAEPLLSVVFSWPSVSGSTSLASSERDSSRSSPRSRRSVRQIKGQRHAARGCRDHLELQSTPSQEPCAPSGTVHGSAEFRLVGPPSQHGRSVAECPDLGSLAAGAHRQEPHEGEHARRGQAWQSQQHRTIRASAGTGRQATTGTRPAGTHDGARTAPDRHG